MHVYCCCFGKQLGPVFTLKVAGERMTFLTESEDFDHFFLSPFVSFQDAVTNAVCKTASISKESFLKHHTNIHDVVKGCLAAGHLKKYCNNLSTQFTSQLGQRWDEKGSGDLYAMIRSVMYVVVLDNIMGTDFPPTADEQAFKKFEEHFISYDEQFDHGAQIPEIFLRKWAKSKAWLLEQLHNFVGKPQVKVGEQSVLQSVLATVGYEYAPNYSLLLMWASLANAIPITFWTMAYILSSRKCLEEIKAETDQVLGQNKAGGDGIALSDLSKMPSIKRCVLEAIRLHSPGTIARRVVKDLPVRGFIIPEGDLLMLSPYWAHRNPRLFPQPESFYPDRWKSVDLEKNVFLDGFVAFGGGRYQCPGRWFALMEIQLFVALMIHSYDIQLLEPVPRPSTLHIVGTQHPSGSLSVSYHRRQPLRQMQC